MAHEDGALVGASVVEWDETNARAWILGPWVTGPADRWDRWGRQLLDAARAQVPAGISDHEICGDVANTRLAALGEALGWSRSVVNHIFVADEQVVQGWPEGDGLVDVRPARDDDEAALTPWHEEEFPRSYLTVPQLPLARAAEGSHTVLVAERDGRAVGYAAGCVYSWTVPAISTSSRCPTRRAGWESAGPWLSRSVAGWSRTRRTTTST